MANDLQAKIQRQISWALINSHHNGLIARASRSILACNTMHGIMSVVSRTLDELGLSGGGRLTTASDSLSFQFGAGLNADFSELLNGNAQGKEGVHHVEKALVFEEINFTLVIIHNDDSISAKELLKENISVFVDIVQGWICRNEVFGHNQQSRKNFKEGVVNHVGGLIYCLSKVGRHLVDSHYRVVDDLNTNLLSHLPQLALDTRQEQTIIGIVNQAMEKQKGLLESQIRQSENLQQVLDDAISRLVKAEA